MRRSFLAIASALAFAACNRAPAPNALPAEAVPAEQSTPSTPASVDSASASGVMPSTTPAVQPAPMPEGSFASYQCDDGSQVEVRFNGIAARVSWPDGRSTQLSQPATTAPGEAQVYSDRGVRIERAGDGLHLFDGSRPETLCTETEASA